MKRNPARFAALVVFAALASFATAEDKPKELVGFVQEQPDGTFFNLCVEGNNLTIYVFDEKKEEKQKVPWNRARMEYQPPSNQRQRVFMTRSEDGLSVRSPHVVRRPIAFQFWLTLFEEGKDEPAKIVTGRLVQPMEGDGKSVSLYDLLPPDQRPNG